MGLSKYSIFLLFTFISFFTSGQSFTLEQFEEELLIFPDNIQYGFGVSFCDFNGDGWDDLSFGSYNAIPKFFLNNNGHFEEIELIADTFNMAKSVVWVDLENDTDLDLFITDYAGECRLYENTGDLILIDITESSGIDLDSSYQSNGSSWGDYDKDGYLDLYVTNYSQFDNDESYNRLYKNNGDGTFEDKTLESGTADELHPGFQGVWIDLNEDNLIDLYVANDRGNYKNTMFMNNGDGTFSDVSTELGLDVYIDAMTNSWGDMDNDGDFDLYMTDSGPGNHFMLNQNGLFTNLADSFKVDIHTLSWGANWLDFDNDMDLDLHVSTSFLPSSDEDNFCFVNNIGGLFTTENEIMPFNTESQYSTAVGDYNNDGYADLVGTTDLSDYATLYKNEGLGDFHYFALNLQGVISNYNGIGTRIELTIGNVTQTRFTKCGEDYLSQDSHRIIFGTGSNTLIDTLKLYWPSGHQDIYYDIATDQSITYVEGSSLNLEIENLGGINICYGDSIQLNYVGEIDDFVWNTGDTTDEINVSSSGSYFVLANTSSGFTFQSEAIDVIVNTTPIPEIEMTEVDCYGESSGSINITLIDSEIDSILWSNNSTEEFINNLSAGIYQYQIWDSNGCSTSDSIEVIQNDTLISTFTVSDASCFESCDGSIEVDVFGGIEPYSVNYENEGSSDFCAGTYSVTVSDSLGCTYNQIIQIDSPNSLEIELELIPANNTDQGGAIANVIGGTPPYSYLWSNGGDSQAELELPIDSYWLEVTDSLGCSELVNFDIVVGLEEIEIQPFLIYPNPTDGIVFIAHWNELINFEIKVFDTSGRITSQWTCDDGQIDLSDLRQGLYILSISNAFENFSLPLIKY